MIRITCDDAKPVGFGCCCCSAEIAVDGIAEDVAEDDEVDDNEEDEEDDDDAAYLSNKDGACVGNEATRAGADCGMDCEACTIFCLICFVGVANDDGLSVNWSDCNGCDVFDDVVLEKGFDADDVSLETLSFLSSCCSYSSLGPRLHKVVFAESRVVLSVFILIFQVLIIIKHSVSF